MEVFRKFFQRQPTDAQGRASETSCAAGGAAAIDFDATNVRARRLYDDSRFGEAIPLLRQLVQLRPHETTLHVDLVWSCLHAGNVEAAASAAQSAPEHAPKDGTIAYARGVVLGTQRKFAEAIVCLQLVPEDSPHHLDALLRLSQHLIDANDPAGAEAALRVALDTHGDRAAPWTRLGLLRVQQHRHADARDAFERANHLEQILGQVSENFVLLATNRHIEGRTQEEIRIYEDNLPASGNAHGHLHYGHALLATGRLIEGWEHYEFRWLVPPLVKLRPAWRRPVWAGQDLHARTILLRIEQGFGDTIQFIRYAPHLKRLGATVLLRVGAGFERFAQGFSGIDRVLGPADPNPDFDFYIHLLSLPRAFGTDLASIPPPASLEGLIAAAPRLAERSGDARDMRIGLVWAGSPGHARDRERSIPLRTLAHLARIEGARFHSLQLGPAAAERGALVDTWPMVDLAPDLDDFADTAAAITQLDLVICVDTAVAHLAATLGKPVWLLVTRVADWRWLEDRDDSPWYPSVRLFRQRNDGDWAEVVARLADALRKAMDNGDFGSVAMIRNDVALRPPPASVAREAPGHRAGFSAVCEARMGLFQFLPEDGPAADAIGWYGEWLQPQLDLLSSLMASGSTLLEIGSGIGTDAIALANCVSAAGRVFLIEPRYDHRQLLQQNLAANGITNTTILRRDLAGQQVKLTVAGARTSPPAIETAAGGDTVDDLAIEPLDWIKIDEGADAATIINGASDTLWQRRPRILVRVGDEATLSRVSAALREFGYRIWRMDTPWFNPGNFNRRPDDIFGGRTALALLAIPEEAEFDVPLPGCTEI